VKLTRSAVVAIGVALPAGEAIDRRFDRLRYASARTLDVFADHLRDEVDLDALRSDVLGAVRQTMAPAHASLWVRERS
jgi:hypothetical protein